MADKPSQSGGGFKIPLCGKATGRSLIRSSDANDLIRSINPLGQIEIVRTQNDYDSVVYSESNVVLALAKTESAPNVEGSITVTEIDGSPSVANVTTIKFPNGSVTNPSTGVVEVSVASLLSAYKIVSVSSDYVTCNTWDGTTAGSDAIKIAIPPELRTEPTLAGDETAEIYPGYAVDGIIWATPTNFTGVTDADLIDLNVDARRWRISTDGCDDEGNPKTAYFDRGSWTDPA